MRFTAKTVDTKSTKRFTLDAQKDDIEADKIVFNIRESLTYTEAKFLKKLLIEDVLEATHTAFQMVTDSIENFFYEDGTPFEIKKDKHKHAGVYHKFDEESATAVPDIAIAEIGNHVFNYYFELGETDVKN